MRQKRQDICAVVALSAKKSKNGKHKNSDDDRDDGSGKKKSAVKLGIVPCNSQMFPKLIKVPGREETFMLADELILHFMPKIFKGHDIAGKSLVRIKLPGRILQKSVQQNALIKKPFSFNLSYIY